MNVKNKLWYRMEGLTYVPVCESQDSNSGADNKHDAAMII